MARQARQAGARLGKARHGSAGKAGLGRARLGSARQAWHGQAWLGKAGHGRARQARLGSAWLGLAWHGEAGTARHGKAWRGMARQARQAWLGKAGRGGAGQVWRGVAWQGEAGLGRKLRGRDGNNTNGRDSGAGWDGSVMNYYQHHIGDFLRDTARLKDTQCMAYLRLIWIYYETEQPLEDDIDALAFKIGADASDVQQLLRHFFFLHDDGMWHQARCDKEILAFRAKSEKAKKSADARWNNANAMRTHSDRKANAMVLDANQEPVTSNQDKDIPDADASSSPPAGGNPQPKADPVPYSAIVDLYHAIDLPRVQLLTSKRKTAIRQRHASLFDKSLQSWEAYFESVSRSDFLMGRVPGKDWRADFDFLVREDSVIKILEGKYHASNQRGTGSSHAAPRLTPAQRIAAKRSELAAQSPDMGTVAAADGNVRASLDEPAGRRSERHLVAWTG